MGRACKGSMGLAAFTLHAAWYCFTILVVLSRFFCWGASPSMAHGHPVDPIGSWQSNTPWPQLILVKPAWGWRLWATGVWFTVLFESNSEFGDVADCCGCCPDMSRLLIRFQQNSSSVKSKTFDGFSNCSFYVFVCHTCHTWMVNKTYIKTINWNHYFLWSWFHLKKW